MTPQRYRGILDLQKALWAIDKRKTGRLVRRKSNLTYSLPSSSRAQKKSTLVHRHESRCSFRKKIFFLLFLTDYQIKNDSRRNNIVRIIVFIASPKLQLQGYVTARFGRALEWHSRGQRFDPAYLHQDTCFNRSGCFFVCAARGGREFPAGRETFPAGQTWLLCVRSRKVRANSLFPKFPARFSRGAIPWRGANGKPSALRPAAAASRAKPAAGAGQKAPAAPTPLHACASARPEKSAENSRQKDTLSPPGGQWYPEANTSRPRAA